jgi:hypothetical protein
MNPTIPEFVFHLWPSEDAPEGLSTIPASPLDRSSGFTHLSTAQRVGQTAFDHYSSLELLWLHEIDTELCLKNGGVFRWVSGPDEGEGVLALVDASGEPLPVPLTWVRSVVALGRPAGGDWREHTGPS